VRQKSSAQGPVADASRQTPKSLAELNADISAAAPLLEGGKKAVLGEGPIGAPIAFVGEQPGDQEDLQGRPFVGPAGQLLDRALTEAGIDRAGCYLTNAVKHFKFEQRGKRRVHQKPTAGEVKHYRWWLDKELAFVRPRLIVALGTTAVLALAGKAMPISRVRGEADFAGRRGYITVHPSYLLRIPDQKAKRQAYGEFVADLRSIRTIASRPCTAGASSIVGRQNRQRGSRAKASA
jgi:uracil-DNA glycosylase